MVTYKMPGVLLDAIVICRLLVLIKSGLWTMQDELEAQRSAIAVVEDTS